MRPVALGRLIWPPCRQSWARYRLGDRISMRHFGFGGQHCFLF